jgi:hypothetical protein
MMRPYPHRDEIYMMNSQSTMQIVWVTGIEIPTLARSHHYQLRVPGNMQSIIAHLRPNQYCRKDGIITLLQQLRSTLVFELIADKDVVQISCWPASC